MPSASELIGHGRTVDEICQEIGADKLIYQDLEDLRDACHEGNEAVKQFEDSVFSGVYLSPEVNEAYLADLDKARNDATKETERGEENEILA